MILLATIVASIRESSNWVIENIVVYFPALVFVELVKNLDYAVMSIWQVLHFHHFSKDPSSFGMFAVNEHILLDLFLFDNGLIIEVLMDKLAHIGLKLISK